MRGRILAVDPGDVRIGIAISDPMGVIASPFGVIRHVSRQIDAGQVAELARQHEVTLIIVGQALGENGELTPQARKAQRFADALKSQVAVPVVLWDESGTTQIARDTRLAMGVSRKKRQGHVDDLAATVLLQSFLDQAPLEKNE